MASQSPFILQVEQFSDRLGDLVIFKWHNSMVGRKTFPFSKYDNSTMSKMTFVIIKWRDLTANKKTFLFSYISSQERRIDHEFFSSV